MPRSWNTRRKSPTSSEMSEGDIEVRDLDLGEVRRIPRIASGYRTERAWRLYPETGHGCLIWTMRDEALSQVRVKSYDDGRVDQWLASYTDGVPVSSLRFLGGYRAGECMGLLTWRAQEWNDTAWLLDIRVRETCRGTGVGSALLDRLKHQTAASRGITVETQTSNYPAVAFYRKHGFRVAGFHDHLYTNHDLADGDVALFLFWEAEP
jgi:ribosomal protein S18 acetylase RimI-like enzyme